MWVVTDSLKTTGNTCAHFTIAALTGRGLQCDVDPYCASVHSWDKGVYTWLVKAHCTGTTVCCLACEVQQSDVVVADVWLFACYRVIQKEVYSQ